MMAVIGIFTATKDGGWAGTIRTLMINAKVRLVPNDKRDSDRAPDFRVLAGQCELGAAWRERASGEGARDYLNLRFDGPDFGEPFSAAFFPSEDGARGQLVWRRRKAEAGSSQGTRPDV